jgi:hypothetical protein
MNRAEQAEQHILKLLAKSGFRVLQREVELPADQLRHGPRFDFLVVRGRRRFALEVKAARTLADWSFHWVARPILVLQAVHRLRRWEPLLAIYVDHLEVHGVQRFKAQARVYAPSLWWILADAKGNVVSHLPDGDDEQVRGGQASGEMLSRNRLGNISESTRSPAAGCIAPRLSFGDLDQWLIKVLLFAPSPAPGWGGPRGSIRSLLQLAKAAQVSAPLVYRWATAMQKSGYLEKQWGKPPALRNLDALLAEWRGRYRLKDNELIACRPIFGQRVDDQYIEEFLGLLRKSKGHHRGYALSGHQACRFHRLRHSDARSIHLYVSDDPSPFLQALQLAPHGEPSGPVVLVRPKHWRSVFRGAAPIDGIMVCDLLQVYLDLYTLPDRGREQADFLSEQVLEPWWAAATEF